MKVLILDNDGEGMGIDLALRAQDNNHIVKYWLPSHKGAPLPYGKGLVAKVPEWEREMDWADLIVLTGNSKYSERLSEYFGKGYPIFGANTKSAALELDRSLGQKVLKDHGVKCVPHHVVTSAQEGIQLICKTEKAYAMKPWGGDADKAMTCVMKDCEHGIFILEKWEKEGKFKGQLMMQEKIDGVEMGISGLFGPGGWNAALEESFEHKKFMNDDLGENTGEMGTVIRHVNKSKLFDMVLEPLTDYLHMCNYVGDCSVNCIIDKRGNPWPLEFTMRLGWPDFCIRQAVIQSDPIEWMKDLVEGRDSLEVSNKIALGVLLAHGDFPKSHDPMGTWAGYPLDHVDNDHIHFQQVMWGHAPVMVNGRVKDVNKILTAGNYVLVATGTGGTVTTAHNAAYAVLDDVSMPSNGMYRTDIGMRLEAELPLIQEHGFAKGMVYE